MPLRDDLLEPIPGDNPSGANLYYDKVFDQIQEARKEEDDTLPEGDWQRTQKKKADHRLVVKLAGEALAKRSKDLRLLSWLLESQFKIEGLGVLVPGLNILRALQTEFWPTLYPEIEDGNDMELRVISIETAAKALSLLLPKVALTGSGLNYEDYTQSRIVGFEKEATTDAKKEARKLAVEQGKLTGEDFDRAFSTTPKNFYLDLNSTLDEAVEAIGALDTFHDESYGQSAPNLGRLKTAIEQLQLVAQSLLADKRKTDPDPVPVTAPPVPVVADAQPITPVQQFTPQLAIQSAALEPVQSQSSSGFSVSTATASLQQPADVYQLVVQCAEYFFDSNPISPVPYLICAGLRLGETRMQGSYPENGFAVGPTSQVRQSLRSLAGRGAWNELLRASLPILAHECSRAWLDLHRYIHRAAMETGAEALAAAVVGTVKSLLSAQPEMRHWTLEDDTGAANPETQQWLDSVVLSS